ncbi:MAG TPA: helix-turn-helix transcriptional regulator [Methylotenera sp.]|nr:helix-turn-helix transcriptional regulator [Methylotenera sp.]HPH05026.1 helix-turn-helix transcriptional regulator [Methylotenera sp.]HPN00288.1 helix-turn-helix transcriptional regulator [Methylotenera sp.]
MDTRRKELAEFLQAMRQRGVPEAFGFPSGARRRTQGLRREEVAQLANISATWYTWIEQGREVNVSAEALDRLALALKLSKSERTYLFDMADRRDPQAHINEADTAPETLINMLESIQIPAYIMGRTWDLLAWNQPAETLFYGWLDNWQESANPNLLRYVFMHPQAKQFVVNWELRARRLVAEFRADCRSRLEEPALQKLVNELTLANPEFDRFWKQHDVLERQGGQREFNHPKLGLISYQQVTLRPVEQEQLKLVLLQPEAIISA